MAITITQNIASLRAARTLSRATEGLSIYYEQLSSGNRLVRPSIDPAALSVSMSLRSQSLIAQVAMRNANDAISVLSITDSALSGINDILTRMGELATQAANGVYTNKQRSAMSIEFIALGSEISRIASTTKFNNIKLLSAASNVVFQVGFSSYSTSQISMNALEGTLESLRLASSGSSSLMYSIMGNTEQSSLDAARTSLAAVHAAIGEVSAKRGMVGAAESRLGVALENLHSARQGFESAASAISDIDVAETVTKMSSQRILQDSAAAVLAHAKAQPAIALQLLRNDR